MRSVVIIPARWDSSRLPGKPLVPLRSKAGVTQPLIKWTWDVAMRSREATEVIVATDSLRIQEEVRRFGGDCRLTSVACRNGTERCLEAAAQLGLDDSDVVINLQGDSPLVPAKSLDRIIRRARYSSFNVCTLVSTIGDQRVKDDGRVFALREPTSGAISHFGRNIVVYPHAQSPIIAAHMGVYSYRWWALQEYGLWRESLEERTIGLEQIRFLDHDMPMLGVEATTGEPLPEVNYPDDIVNVEGRL